jgi:hypothetical protein
MDQNPFIELPAALVQEVLDRTGEISQALSQSFDVIKYHKETWRSQLIEKDIVRKEKSLPIVPVPTSCGVDGAFALERLLATDLVIVGAVAVEGLTPPSETRYWPETRHSVYVDTEVHDADTGSIVRGLMAGMELQLAQIAPHELVFLDGSLTTPTIFFNQAINRIANARNMKISKELERTIRSSLNAYKKILTAGRSDHYWIAIPKYTTKREIGEALNWPEMYDDRGLLTILLEAGEYTLPMPLKQPDDPWHINTKFITTDEREEIKELAQEVISLLDTIYISYYRPYTWLPAFRIELAQSIALSPAGLSKVLTGIRHQCVSSAILEVYPLYMADRMVKHLAKAVPAFRQITSQNLAENYKGDISEVLISLHGYRTEAGA